MDEMTPEEWAEAEADSAAAYAAFIYEREFAARQLCFPFLAPLNLDPLDVMLWGLDPGYMRAAHMKKEA